MNLKARKAAKRITIPSSDRTGPAGMNPMTGRAADFCAGYLVLGYMNSVAECKYWCRGLGGGG